MGVDDDDDDDDRGGLMIKDVSCWKNVEWECDTDHSVKLTKKKKNWTNWWEKKGQRSW